MTITTDAVTLPSGVRLPLVRQGDPNGVPVLLLHGYSDSWLSFQTTMEHLPAGVDAIAVTQRGHGDADRPAAGYAIDDFAGDAIAVLDALGIERAVIAGHSMGAWVAEQVAARFPQRVLGVVLAAPLPAAAASPVLAGFGEEVARLEDPIDRAFAREFQIGTTEQPLDDAQLEAFVDESMKLPARVWREVYAGFLAFDPVACLRAVTAPVLFVCAEQDAFATRDEQEQLLAATRDGRMVRYAETGHAVHWERPGRFAADLTAFAAEVGRR